MPQPTSKSALLGLTLLLGTHSALSQAQDPDPFSDYEAERNYDASAEAGDSRSASYHYLDEAPELRTEAGSFSVGARTMLSWSSRRNELASGPDARNSTLFVRAAPMVHWFVIDDVELGIGFGPMVTNLARPGGSTVSETDWHLELGAHYYLKLTPRFAIAPGIGVGPYFGQSEQELTVTADGEQTTVTEATDTLGLAATLYLSAVYQLAPEVQLRSGLALAGLVGRENIPSESENYSSRGANLSIPVELYYNF